MTKIKLIHPKTGTVREVDETNVNKIALLKRAKFVPLKGYRAPKPPEVVVEPSLAEAVEKNKVDPGEAGPEGSDPEISIHISGPARNLAERNDLDPADIEGTGRDGQITKPDVKAYLKALKEEAKEAEEAAEAQEEEKAPEAPKAVEDIRTHDDAPEPGEAPETGPGDEPAVRPATEDEEAAEAELSKELEEAAEDLEEEKYPPVDGAEVPGEESE